MSNILNKNLPSRLKGTTAARMRSALTVCAAVLLQACATTGSVPVAEGPRRPALAVSTPATATPAPAQVAAQPMTKTLTWASQQPRDSDRAQPAPVASSAASSDSGSQLAQVERRQRDAAAVATSPSPPPTQAALAQNERADTRGRSDSVTTAGLPAPLAPRAAPSGLQPAILRGPQPDLFGSVALVVTRTPEDAQWRRVSTAALPAEGGPWTAVLRRARGLSGVEQLQTVNAWVNAAIAFTSDAQQYGVADYWATAEESLRSGRGDCEDYAIAKMQMLRALGVPQQDMYLVIVHDLVRRADHAVLAVREDGRFWIMDSAARVMPAESVQDYRPVMTFSAGHAWIHGYRREPSLIMASAANSSVSPASGQ